ncbi:hypothetical protein LCGC14_1887540 [marine sediment metagenome]|uniref:Uncharacterized protein n=1 Tax=marine sediment metagenome TaxID=412755 RepID=A0A0F9G0D6_9ZZZZ|nr:hypothetical protein [Pricia sp.]
MKKLIVLLIMLVMVAGCQEESAQNSRETLLNPEKATIDFAKQWVDKYGTTPESVDNYNHTFVRLVVDQNAKVMNKLVEATKGSTEETGKQLSALSARQDELKKIIGDYPSEYDTSNSENTVIGAISLHTNAINQFREQIDINTALLASLSATQDTIDRRVMLIENAIGPKCSEPLTEGDEDEN